MNNEINKMDIKTYINQFSVLGKDDINCDNLSQMLYSALLNKFRVEFTKEEYGYFKEYQERVFNLVENLREMNSATISLVFDYISKINNYLVDIIIMLWCLPRSDNLLSKRIYNVCYKENIQKYNEKLIKNICHKVMENFCIETLTKTNYVPIHCIDYIWFYMNTISMEFTFYNSESSKYIGFIMPENNEHNKHNKHNKHNENDEYIKFEFNMEYMLDLGLGQVIYDNDPVRKCSFRFFLKNIMIDINVVKKLLTGKTASNLKKQLLNISKNPSKYFGDNFFCFPKEIVDELNK